MRHIREVLRLHYSVGMSQRAVARSLGLAQGTVSKYLNRTRRAGLTWPLPPELDDDVRLENRLYPPPSDRPSDERPQPDWALVHRELRRPNVTLMLLWEEYCDANSDCFSYSWFCERYKEWAGLLKPTLRQIHVAGEKLFVDYSGHTMEVVDGLTGEVRSAQIFVAVLGASNYTYAEASLSQSLPDWIASHVRAFAYFGGAARQTVSDNLKAGITRACFHEPMVNRTYADLARHYRTAIVPARPYRPRDKAKVEVGVQIVGRWILARLRNHRFFSLAALNEAIHALLVELNDRPLRSWGRSRRDLFEELDRPALTPLPDEPYQYAEWKRCRVNLDYPEAAEMPHADWLGLLVDREVTARDNRRLTRRLSSAKLRQAAAVKNVDYHTARGLDRSLFQALATCQWIREANHLVIIGPTGTGKSWLACALGNKACRDGFSVLYKRAPRLFADLAQARGEGRLARLIAALERVNLLILDDWGPEPLTADQRRDLLEIVDDRYDKGSLLITSQVPVSQWHDVRSPPSIVSFTTPPSLR
ncbi:IS21 family transposase [Bradyrhizobium sp. RDM4]